MSFPPVARLTDWAKAAPSEVKIVFAIGVIALGVIAFGAMAEDVLDGESHRFDAAILQALRTPGDLSQPIGPAWLTYAMTDITALGGYTVLTLFSTLSGLYLIVRGQMQSALLLLGAITTGSLLVLMLKLGIDRPRPELVTHLTHVDSPSFPSGHATSATLVYLSLGLLLSEAQNRKRDKVFFLASALFIAALIGISRVYLGVHWPSDVIAGWGLGAAWAVSWWLVVRILRKWRAVGTDAES